MKKLLFAAVVGLIAATSQAYNVTWGALNVKTPIAADVAVAQAGITGTGDALTGLAIDLFWVSTAGDVFIGTFDTSAGKVSTQTLGAGTDSDLYTAMVADRGTDWNPVYHMTATYVTADGTYTFDGTATAGQKLSALATKNVSATANFGSIAGWSYTPVPEPTSGLLMLLGVAGLALRRKRA